MQLTDLTPGQIDAMPAGAEMDAAVAEAMGLTCVWDGYGRLRGIMVASGEEPFHPSTDWRDAALVWAALPAIFRGRRVQWDHTSLDGYEWVGPSPATMGVQRLFVMSADTFPLAVCRAFLMAKLPETANA